MKSNKGESKSADTLDKIAIDGVDGEASETKSDRKENAKIRFVQCTDNEPSYHTPISFKMNKFMMCFKSEPDLSRVQSGSDDPVLNRGRFIAKKLLSGVSMINLRRPFANSSEKATITSMETATPIVENCPDKMQSETITALEVPECAVETYKIPSVEVPAMILDDKIDDDDEDFVDDEEVDREYEDCNDKENRSPIPCNTIDFITKLKPSTTTTAIGVNIPLADSITNDSVSPITKSTHRMSKAMQVQNHKFSPNQDFNLTLKFNFNVFVFFRFNCISKTRNR